MCSRAFAVVEHAVGRERLDDVVLALVRSDPAHEQPVGASLLLPLLELRQHTLVDLAVEPLEVEEDRRDRRWPVAVRGDLGPIELGVGEAEAATRRERGHLVPAPLDGMEDRWVPLVEELRGGDVVIVDDERLGA